MELCFKYPLLYDMLCVCTCMHVSVLCVCVCARVHVYCLSYYIPQEGVLEMHWCHSAPFLYTTCLDGMVRLWDARNASTVGICMGGTHVATNHYLHVCQSGYNHAGVGSYRACFHLVHTVLRFVWCIIIIANTVQTSITSTK